MKVRVTNVAPWRSAYVAFVVKMLRPHLNTTSSRHKGVLLDLDMVYSTGRKGKKYATIIMSHLAQRTGSPEALATLYMFWRT